MGSAAGCGVLRRAGARSTGSDASVDRQATILVRVFDPT